jgi:hypothetical protein
MNISKIVNRYALSVREHGIRVWCERPRLPDGQRMSIGMDQLEVCNNHLLNKLLPICCFRNWKLDIGRSTLSCTIPLVKANYVRT